MKPTFQGWKEGDYILNITDLSLLKITKVKDWAIYFDYDGRHYLIHGGSELGEGSWQDFYERILDEYGHYELHHIGTKPYAKECVVNDYIKRQKGHTVVYRNINKEYFVYKLTKRGFATGIMEERVIEEEKYISKIEKQIKKYEEKICLLRQKINELK